MLEKDLEEFIICNCPMYTGGLCAIEDCKYDCIIHSPDLTNNYFDELAPSDTDHMCRVIYGIYDHQSFEEIWSSLKMVEDVNRKWCDLQYIQAHQNALEKLFPNKAHIWRPDLIVLKAMKD